LLPSIGTPAFLGWREVADQSFLPKPSKFVYLLGISGSQAIHAFSNRNGYMEADGSPHYPNQD